MKKLSNILKESVWQGILDRGTGETIKKEDELNNKSPEEFVDYLKDHYVINDHRVSDIKYILNRFINIPIAVVGGGKYIYTWNLTFNSDIGELTIPSDLKHNAKKLWPKLIKKFKLHDNGSIAFVKDKSINNTYALEFIDFIIDNIDDNVTCCISRKTNESTWGGMLDRGSGETERKENIGAELEIDGVKYTFTKDFWEMGDRYKDENECDWTCFAFNKMPDGSKTISGDTEVAGAFASDKNDFNDYKYDIYVLKDYFEKTKEELVQISIDNGGDINDMNLDVIKKILIDYTEEIFEKHMSDYAYYYIYNLQNTDWSYNLMNVYTTTDDFDDIIIDEFEDNIIKEAHFISFPILKNTNWSPRLEAVLKFAYEKLGYKMSNEYELDPFDSPSGTRCICFVLLGEVKENTEEDDENHRDY